MRAGQLRHRITVERSTSASDALGAGAPPTWAPVASSIPANVRPATADEITRAGIVGQETAYTVECRYGLDVAAGDRVTCDGRTIHLRSVLDPEGRRRRLELVGTERVEQTAV